jgi:hypothetical protein
LSVFLLNKIKDWKFFAELNSKNGIKGEVPLTPRALSMFLHLPAFFLHAKTKHAYFSAKTRVLHTLQIFSGSQTQAS